MTFFFNCHLLLLACCQNIYKMGTCAQRLENIDENVPANWIPDPVSSCPPPETPTESMEFLARSWSLSAIELSKALSFSSNTHIASTTNTGRSSFSSTNSAEAQDANAQQSKERVVQPLPSAGSASGSPRDSAEVKVYRSILKGKTMGRWLKDQKERKKQEIRTHNAQLHAAVSVAGVAAAVAALAASNAMSIDKLTNHNKCHGKTSAAIASAAALVASHCIDLAEEMGADHQQISAVVNSAVNARTNGDIMALTAGAATALRGAATLRARLQKGYVYTTALGDDKGEGDKEIYNPIAIDFVAKGGEILKRTRKGALHWKEVSFTVNSNLQVVAKLKSKHIAGTFTKKKKYVVCGVSNDIPAWPGREREDNLEDKAYFGIKIVDRVIEFECLSKGDKEIWTEGIQHMLNYCSNMT